MNLLLTGAFKYSEEQLYIIRLLGFDIAFVQDERATLNIDVSDTAVVVCNGLFLYNDITEFKNLKFIQLTSAGLDRVPVKYIEEHGINLFNAAGVYSVPMAEWVILKILEIYKQSRQFYEAQAVNKWQKRNGLLELAGKTAAIIGFGSVGMEIAKRLNAFGVHITGVDTRGIEAEEACLAEGFCKPFELDSVLGKSDIVILTLPLNEYTRHLMNSGRFAAMKQESVLINVSRGGVIDEAALIENLKAGKFLGAALDVFEEEPLQADNALWDFGNLIITPHNSYVSEKTNERLFSLIVSNLSKIAKADA